MLPETEREYEVWRTALLEGAKSAEPGGYHEIRMLAYQYGYLSTEPLVQWLRLRLEEYERQMNKV